MATQFKRPVRDGFIPTEMSLQIYRSLVQEIERTQLTNPERAQEVAKQAEAQYNMIRSLSGLIVPISAAHKLMLEGSGKAERNCYDCEEKEDLPGKLIRHEGQPEVSDGDINKIYDFAGIQRTYLKEVFGWNSWDNKFADLLLCAHYGWQWNNAAFTGKYMIFGNGNREIFKTFVLPSVMWHEIGHGITASTCGLVYNKQSGILNEFLSDAEAANVEMYHSGDTVDKHHWLIGKGIWADEDVNLKDRALRDMANPGTAYNNPMAGKDRQPANAKDYDPNEESDYGGVHKYSGIPNKAYHDMNAMTGGHALDNGMAHLLWEVRLRLESNAQFQDFTDMCVRVAKDMFGPTDARTKNVRDALKGVGFNPTL